MKVDLLTGQRFLIGFLFFVVILAILPLTPDPSSDIKILVYQLFTLPLLVLWAVETRTSRKGLTWRTPLPLLMAVFVILNLIAAVASLNPGYSLFKEFAKTTSCFIVFVAASHAFRAPKHLWNFAAAACIAASLASLYGLVQYAGLDPFPWQDTSRMLRSAPATFGNPNFASHFLAPLVILAAGLAFQPKRRWTALLIPLFIAHFALTKTRGSLLALALVVVMVSTALVLSRVCKRQKRAVLATFAVLVLASGVSLAAGMTFSNLKQGTPYPHGSISIRLRYHSFYGACMMIQDRPLLGHGPGMYQVLSPRFWTPFEKEYFRDANKMNDHVHNEPLEVAVDIGLPAAIVFLALMVVGMTCGLFLWYSGAGHGPRSVGLTLAAFFLCFLVDGLFGFNFHVPASSLLFFIMLGATAGITANQDEAQRPVARPRPRTQLVCLTALLVLAVCLTVIGLRDFSAKVLNQRGRGAYDQAYYTEAVQLYKRAAAIAPYDWNHFHWLGVANGKTGDFGAAADSFKRALSLNPFHYHAHIMLAEALLHSATSYLDPTVLDEAISSATRAEELNNVMPEPHEILGQALLLKAASDGANRDDKRLSMDTLQKAEDHLLLAAKYDSKQPHRVYRILAEVRGAKSDLLGAKEALVKSLEDKPDELPTWQLFWHISRNSGDYSHLLASMVQHLPNLELSQASSSFLANLNLLKATVLADGLGDDLGAEQVYLHIANSYPEELPVWSKFYTFAEAKERKGGLREALLNLHDLMTQQNSQLELPSLLEAVVTASTGTDQDVTAGVTGFLNALQQEQTKGSDAAKLEEGFAWAANLLAEQVEQTSLPPEMEGDIYLKLGLAYGAWNDFESAAELLARALPHLPKEQAVLCLTRLASALTMTDKHDEAVAALEKARILAPSDFDVRYALAEALSEAGQAERAAIEYKGILRDFGLTEKGKRLIEKKMQDLAPKLQHG